MLNDIIELADNKLLILYIIKKLKHPCTNEYITDIVLNNNFFNYFLLQQYLNDLVESNYLIIISPKNETLYKLAPRGKKILEMFQNRISQFKIDCFNSYMNSLNKKEETLEAEISYSKLKSEDFLLEIKFNKNKNEILFIKLTLDSKENIEDIIKNCKENPKNIYNLITSSLLNKKNDT